MWPFHLFRTLTQQHHISHPLVCIVPSEDELDSCAEWMAFLGLSCPLYLLPPRPDTPYSKVVSESTASSTRLHALLNMARADQPFALVTTPEALMQKLPPRPLILQTTFLLQADIVLSHQDLQTFLQRAGYTRVPTVYEPGDYTVRGSMIDVYSPSMGPLRLDFFGDVLETLCGFDPLTQRTHTEHPQALLGPAREVILTPETIRHFRHLYREQKGFHASQDLMYQQVSEGIYTEHLESYLPLFYETPQTLFGFLPAEVTFLTPDFLDADLNRVWADLHKTAPSVELPWESFYLNPSEVMNKLQNVSPARSATSHSSLVPNTTLNPSQWFQDLETTEPQKTQKVVFCASSEQGFQRAQTFANLHHLNFRKIDTLDQADRAGLYITEHSGLSKGFHADTLWLVTEEDVFGPKRKALSKTKSSPEALLLELTSLKVGDYIVHQTHGIGQYVGLVTLDLQGAAHECCALTYEGDDKLFVPVEHIHLLSRYGGADTQVTRDRLGSTAWQTRKAKVQKRLKMMTDQLIQMAAERSTQEAIICQPDLEAYETFCSGFAYVETDDQMQAIQDVLEDMASGHPMDRVICGDVGFGKTEVAMRAAYAMVAQGHQVVVVCPTTLLCRQHTLNFQKRFSKTPFRVEQLSRMVPAQKAAQTRAEWNEGQIHILVATHAVLNQKLAFPKVGLLILDEEQHFGVTHKEKFKALQPKAHLLTLSATPIPRTFQMALSGIRTLSLIRTPPVDRTAVHTMIGPWDIQTVTQVLDREFERNGQAFIVAPHIEDLAGISQSIKELRPQWTLALAHGQMPVSELEETMTRFVEGQIHILICTSIVESGLDVPRANTIIIYKGDHFGLAQLYQLRGRVGRSDIQAYAYISYEPDKALTQDAQKRLTVMRTLDHLGASFMLAHHDMDIRGAGNLLGAEQSGHIRDVGIELYQTLLAEAVQIAKHGDLFTATTEWTPTLNVGLSLLIPEIYIPDLEARFHMYRTINQQCMQGKMDEARTMLHDRFGAIPVEVDQLLRLMDLQRRCLQLHISKIDAGPRGAVIEFWQNQPPVSPHLIPWIQKNHPVIKLRPDGRLTYQVAWADQRSRLKGLEKLIGHLEKALKGA